MTTYSFTLIVEGLDDTSEDHVGALIAKDEVIAVSSSDGAVSVDLAVDARDSDAAIRAGLEVVEVAVPGCSGTSIDLDLVAATDVARRVGVSRQAVNLWITGGDPAHRFPAPLGHVAGGTRVWSWSSVVPWLQTHGRAVGDSPLTYAAILDANARLARSRLEAQVVG